MMPHKAALPPLDTPALARLFGQRRELLTTWRRLYESSVEAEPRIDSGDFESVFGRELDGLRNPQLCAQPEAVQATLRATALCFARRGIPLSHLLSAAAATEAAVRETRGNLGSSEQTTLTLLETARARAYSHAYLDSDASAPPSCERSLVPLRTPRNGKPNVPALVGGSAAMRRIHDAIALAAEGPDNILIAGESGTGKELVARAIHEASGRGRFVATDASSLSAGEPYGNLHGRTSAPGLLAAADGGTLFLDEITDLSAEVQAALSRLLEGRRVQAVGAEEETPVDVRVIASTSRDPETEMASGRLRRELYYRLSAFTMRLPPLRERRDDVPELVEHFLGTFCHRRCGCIWGVSEPAMRVLTAARWPGNVRQLRNAVEHAVTRGDTALIQLEDLPADLQRGEVVLHPAMPASRERALPSLAESEAELIRETLRRFDGNKVRTAQSLGISRNKLYDRLRKLGLS